MPASLLALLKRAWRVMASLLGESSGATLALTGILGLAAVLYVLYQLRGGPGRKPDEQGGQQREQQQQLDGHTHKPSTSAATAGGSSAAVVAPSAAVSRRLAGIKRVTMSVPGVLLQESSPGDLDESASVRPEAVALARDIVRCCSQGLYLMCHVDDDIGEAVVRGALEHAGLLGRGPGQVPPHRLLFCETLLGKVSMVRQLEPDLHIDSHPQTVSDLQRFVKQLLLVQSPTAVQNLAGSSAAAAEAANVQHAASLAAAMGVPGA